MEFATAHAFSDANFADLKSMWEGDGAMISVNKYVAFEELFVDGYFIIATNKLPLVARENHPFHQGDWIPLKSRFEMTTFVNPHEGTTKFPYTVEEFALALDVVLKNEPNSEKLTGEPPKQEIMTV